MAWDSSRPVPWQRLIREWLFYVAIMLVVLWFAVDEPFGAIAGLLVSGPLYLIIGAVMAKFGYTRQRLRRAAAPAPAPSTERATPRSRPAPTSRTGARNTTRKRRR
ncbi:MAG: hypothetical protein O3A28_02810 [Actinomycetota bacterium]|jgi:hypothetical protein|nr:hypothetical protein [Ilumatobacteraceae bacterium]MDA2958921.1 hypothetical protein [Actinomycetota bacterium]MDA3006557.1 hypothetical protein [Actinomycetota bacterium]MDA3033945.1 hypothetical protein [Actinomycetota bacterium]